MLLDSYDTIEGRRVQCKEDLLAARAKYGPGSNKTKKLVAKLAYLDKAWAEVEADEKKVRNLGLLKMPTKIAAGAK